MKKEEREAMIERLKLRLQDCRTLVTERKFDEANALGFTLYSHAIRLKDDSLELEAWSVFQTTICHDPTGRERDRYLNWLGDLP